MDDRECCPSHARNGANILGMLDLGIDDAMDKLNQLPHARTGKIPQQIWVDENKPELSNVYIFGQLGYVPVMNKTEQQSKKKNRGRLMRYIRRDLLRHIYAETTEDP